MAAVVAGCTASGDTGALPGVGDPEEDGGTAVLPPLPGTEDASSQGDAAKKDGGKADADAGKDSGPPAPTAGTPCTTSDAIVSRSCGKCGKQETICQAGGDGGLVWTEYGPCAGEIGTCLPGATQSCGNCGTQTCTTSCGWGACTGQPLNNCAPGAIQNTTAGCPTSGFRSRTCGATCTWGPYATTCDGATAVDLFAGPASYSTLMKSSDGKTFAWGLDDEGQLGDSLKTNKPKVVPVPLANVVSLGVGGATTYGFSCASFSDGSAKCWGYNSASYTLGDGVTSTSLAGVTPTGFGTNVTTMVAGYAHGCGLFADGTAKCWGYNVYGQLGNASTTTSKTPVDVGLSGITQLSSGYYTVCALQGDAAYCWGYNNAGQVGDGTTANKTSPTMVIPSGVASIAPGYYHSCAVMADASAMCWGDNANGSVGNGATGADVLSPVAVVGVDGLSASLSDVAEVCAGQYFSCARLTDGRVACWGSNASGQLGIGSTTASSVPKIVSGVTTASKITCGYSHACAIETGGKVKCWGDNQYGQIGNGAMPTDATTPQVTIF